jgi:hypothetical protein
MTIPESWNTLSDFTKWYVDNNYPIVVPANVQVFPTDVSYSICVFRHDVYQVELYIAKPEFMSSKHSHPFEQQIIFLGGDMWGNRENGRLQHLDDKDKYNVGHVLPPNHWHQVGSGMQGFVFFNCQKWPTTKMMTSAVVEYGGESLGPLHKKILK